jgi:hypothetical protein
MLLKKSYPNADMPEYTIFSDYRAMLKDYEASVRRLTLDSTVETYKQYLIGGFMVVEFVFGRFLHFDMQGFATQQMMAMNSYERLLIELGEKSYMPTGSKWPVEIRLLMLIMMNAAIFLVGKMIMKNTGANLMNMVNNITASARPKKKMRGPTINVEDLPDEELANVTGPRPVP